MADSVGRIEPHIRDDAYTTMHRSRNPPVWRLDVGAAIFQILLHYLDVSKPHSPLVPSKSGTLASSF